jgi:hypothetical protein
MALDVASLIIACSSIVIAILSHVKKSKCTSQGIEITTRDIDVDETETKVKRDPLLRRHRRDSI